MDKVSEYVRKMAFRDKLLKVLPVDAKIWTERQYRALLTVAQQQTMSTRATEAGIYHPRQEPRHRLCKKKNSETLAHNSRVYDASR